MQGLEDVKFRLGKKLGTGHSENGPFHGECSGKGLSGIMGGQMERICYNGICIMPFLPFGEARC